MPLILHDAWQRAVERENANQGSHRATKKFARSSITNEQKLHTIRKVREYGMASAIRELFQGLTSSQASAKRRQVYHWVESANAIEQSVRTGKGGHRKTRDRGHATVLPADAEEHLVFWINDLRKEGLPVSPRMLAFQAREIATELSISRDSFSASWCWRKLSLDKHHLSVRRKTHIGQKTPEDSQQVAAGFSVAVREAIIEHNIAAVYNADQTAMDYEYIPNHTINERGERAVWVRNSGVEKNRVAVMLLADSSGNRRPPFAVLKKRPSSVPETRAINHERQHGFGWRLGRDLLNDGANRDSNLLQRTNMSENTLLMWDDFSGHWTKKVRDYAASINVALLKIPAGYTSVCQPADMTWMKPLKQRLRDKWVSSMEEQLRASSQ